MVRVPVCQLVAFAEYRLLKPGNGHNGGLALPNPMLYIPRLVRQVARLSYLSLMMPFDDAANHARFLTASDLAVPESAVAFVSQNHPSWFRAVKQQSFLLPGGQKWRRKADRCSHYGPLKTRVVTDPNRAEIAEPYD